ncbi:hypothetical protein F2Q69_00037627 [Brassica cretica]|uniref:Reverse transcriptase zinc-binding domain-containing protein n=1 Tax=Brassica cretica TaxID=69181 RepID=A0A8S9SK85_BRACR|nr:hypothetical protein F2Q69_00037627 [Brassica cretica]
MIWKAQLLQKIQLFLWKVMHNAVPTSENLQKRGLLENTNCIRCGERDTTIHLFFHCYFAQRVWELAPWSSPANLTQALSFGEKLVASNQRINLPPVGLGWLFTDQNLTEIGRGYQFQDQVSSALLAEGFAVRAALLRAVSSGYTNIWLRSDSQVLVKAINLKHRPSELYGTLTDIASISASSFASCRFSYVS